LWSSRNPQQGELLAGPTGLAFDSFGNLYVSDGDKKILKLDPNGKQTIFF
jgi:hypothetical protein